MLAEKKIESQFIKACDSILVRFGSLECVGFMLTSSKTHENCTHASLLLYLHRFWPFRDVTVPYVGILCWTIHDFPGFGVCSGKKNNFHVFTS